MVAFRLSFAMKSIKIHSVINKFRIKQFQKLRHFGLHLLILLYLLKHPDCLTKFFILYCFNYAFMVT